MIMGMIESRQGNRYSPYKGINKDIYSWKRYNISEMEENDHNLLELKFNLTDATLLGSGNHIKLMTEVISRY